MKDFLFILLYGVIVGLVIEMAVVLFTATGLKKTIARFQVISMLTGTGFTTDESSLIIDHPIRRRLSASVILFGYFSLAVIISSIATLLVNDLKLRLLVLVIAFLIAVQVLLKNGAVFRYLERKFERRMDEQFELEDWPLKTALELGEEDGVALLAIEEDCAFIGGKCQGLLDDEDDIHVLFIRRGDRVLRKSLFEETLQAGDQVLVFGDRELIDRKFSDMLAEEGAAI
ncbi:potassium transporter TrkA [Sporosarcina sp. NCCP-2716]|uniref:TrkA C-terminal domain-containing protein n=1 Tax=Sporosarcina sp. NCCP-2716 TaxID=2943679 RepID=UPI00203AB1CF|nr:TrkA C-terminal domain-containing protein [Sporosarcina sp. NCCP-2716]GKV69731.1 potassium transporter TrkA [Sporosarcina sp. NCCP-2716]